MTAGEFHITGYAAQRVATDAGPELASALAGATGVFTSNIPAGKPIPTGGGILFVPPRDFTIGTDGLFYELLDDGSTSSSPGINLTANDPAFELSETLQWQVRIDKYSIGGNLTDIASWWFDAPAPGWSGPIDELTPVPAVDQQVESRGFRGFSFAGLVPADGDTAIQALIESLSGPVPIGDPVALPSAAWSTIMGKPAVVASGADAAAARASISVSSTAEMTTAINMAPALRGGVAIPFLGDSLTAINANTATDTFGVSYPTLACFLTGGRYIFAGNFGVASNTVQQIAARVGDVIAVKPARCMVLAGTNSTTKGIAHFDDARSVYETGIIQPLLAAGIQPTICTIPPRDFVRQWAADGFAQGPGVYQLTLAWNVFVRAMAVKYRLPLCDMYAAMVDPTTGNFIDGYSDDGIHWSGGLIKAAQAAADSLTNPTVPSVSLERDRYSIINLFSSPLFLSGLGSGSGSAFPPGWNGSNSNVATSIVDPTTGDGLEAGKWLRLAKTGSLQGNVNMIRTLSSFASSNGVTVSAGHRVALGFRYKLTVPIFDPAIYVSVSLTFRNGSGTTLAISTPLSQIVSSHSGVVWWESIVPAGTADIRFDVGFSIKGDSTLDIGQMTLYDLTAMGCPSFRAVDQAIPASSLTTPPNPTTPVPEKPVIAPGTATATTVPYTITPSVVGTAPTSYVVQYCTAANYGTWTTAAPTTATGTITGLTNNQPYWIRARGVNAGGSGQWSDYVQVTTVLSDSPPAQVTGLAAGTATMTTQALSWTAAALTTGYIVQYKRSVDSTWITFSTPTGTSATVTGLTANTSYDYRVAATNNAGTGTYSSTATATTAAAPTALASDSFNRANTASGVLGALDYANGGSVTGLSWTAGAQMQITSNQVVGTPTNVRWSTVNLGVNNAYVEVEIVAGSGGVVGRIDANSSPTAYYQWRYNASDTTCVLERRASSATTVLWTSAAGVFTPGAGQTLGLDIQGTSITPYINGVAAHAAFTDSAVSTGLWGIRSADVGVTYTLDNFLAMTYKS